DVNTGTPDDDGSGADGARTTAGGSPWCSAGTMKTAGCAFVAPPAGISATARCVPGASRGGAGAGAGRTAAIGCETSVAKPPSVPASAGWIASYWPAGHHA